MRTLRAACTAAALSALASAGATNGQVIIGDDDFAEADWDHTIMWQVPTATIGPMSQQLAGGNPGAYQRARHVTQGPFAAIYDGHFYTAVTYNPQTQGAVLKLDVAYDHIDFSPGGIQSGLAVRQAGKTYKRYVDSSGPHTAWVALGVNNITPNDNQWEEVSASGITPGAPDFSAAGAPLEVGYYTFNWSLPQGFLIDREWGIDNFRVTIYPDVCYPDCNASGGLTIADFGCFQAAFAGGNMYADCNASGTLTIADFGCFQAAFGAGCP